MTRFWQRAVEALMSYWDAVNEVCELLIRCWCGGADMLASSWRAAFPHELPGAPLCCYHSCCCCCYMFTIQNINNCKEHDKLGLQTLWSSCRLLSTELHTHTRQQVPYDT